VVTPASAARRARSTPPAAGPSPTDPGSSPLAPVEGAPRPARRQARRSIRAGNTGPVTNAGPAQRVSRLGCRATGGQRRARPSGPPARRWARAPTSAGCRKPLRCPDRQGLRALVHHLRCGVVRLPGSSSTPQPGPRSAHRRRVPCAPPTLRTGRCGPRATRTGAPGHRHRVPGRELSASVGPTGPTGPTGRVHCRPAGAGGGSPSRRHRGSPTYTSHRPDHARPPPIIREAPSLPVSRAWTPHRSPWPRTGRRWDAATAPVHPQRRPSAIPEQSSAPCTLVTGRQALAGPWCPRGTWLVGGPISVVVSGRVLPTCCAPVYAAAPVGGLAAPSGSGRSRPAPERPCVPAQTRGGPATTRRPGRTSGH